MAHRPGLWSQCLADLANAEPPNIAFRMATRTRAEYIDPQRWVVFSDTEPTLTALSRRGWRHIVLSNHVPELPQLVKALDLGHHFEHVFTSASLGYEKPHSSAFEAVAAGIPKGDRVIMVGDSFVADYLGARSVGLNSILVRNSHPECEQAFPDLHALLHYLDEA